MTIAVPPGTFHCVNDHVPAESVDFLRTACSARGIEFVEIDARSFEYESRGQLPRGSLLYRPAISLAAMRVEQFLIAEGVATFYTDPLGAFFTYSAQWLLFQRAGVPIARTLPCFTIDRERLRACAEHLGGFPLVIKVPGNSGGLGVLRVDSSEAFFSTVDYVMSRHDGPLLCAYVGNAVHWRVVVVGSEAVAAYRNPKAEGDFRTYGTARREDCFARVDERLASLAVRAVSTLRLEFGGVDILEDADGGMYVLEANFPCYHPHAQEVAGIDVSGKMVDYLVEKSKRL